MGTEVGTEVWVAGRVTDASRPRHVLWRLLGIFDHVAGARDACRTNRDFYRRFELNVLAEKQELSLSAIHFPLKEK